MRIHTYRTNNKIFIDAVEPDWQDSGSLKLTEKIIKIMLLQEKTENQELPALWIRQLISRVASHFYKKIQEQFQNISSTLTCFSRTKKKAILKF